MADSSRKTSKDFAAFTKKYNDYFSTEVSNGNGLAAFNRFDELLNQTFPNGVDRKAYREWRTQRSFEERQQSRVVVSPGAFFMQISKTNFLDNNLLYDLIEMVNRSHQPYLPLGTNGGTGYQLCPNFDFLRPHHEPNPLESRTFSDNVLGVNLDVFVTKALPNSRKRNRSQNASDDSVQSTDITNLRKGEGFCFFVLGELDQYSGVRPWSQVWDSPTEAAQDNWRATGYGVVVQLSEKGVTGAIWIIYNTHVPKQQKPGESYTSAREHTAIDESKLLQASNGKKFLMTKIADSIQDFNVDHKLRRPLVFSEAEGELQETEVHLVGAKLVGPDGDPSIIRQYVAPA